MNQAAGTSRGAESRRARPTTCPGSPGKVGEVPAPPGVPEWPRELAGKELGRSCPVPLHRAGRSESGAGTSAGSLGAGGGRFNAERLQQQELPGTP